MYHVCVLSLYVHVHVIRVYVRGFFLRVRGSWVVGVSVGTPVVHFRRYPDRAVLKPQAATGFFG